MIDWPSIKKAADGSVSLERIPMDTEGVVPFQKDDDTLLRSVIREAANASGEPLSDKDLDEQMTKVVERGLPYRIMKDNVPVGAAVIGHFAHRDPDTDTDYEGQSINDLAVLPEYQNQGVGKEAVRLLIKEMVHQKPRPKWLHIAHANSNDRAAHVYKEMGFGHPTAWNDKATSLHMRRGEARRLLKEWEKRSLASGVRQKK